MMAANYRHIGGGENRLGRHYSRFSGFCPTAFLADQSLASRKFQNGGSNRRSRARGASCVASGFVVDLGSRRQSASGLGRSWKWKAMGTVPLPPSFSHGARSPLVVHTPRPFHPPLTSSVRPSRPLA